MADKPKGTYARPERDYRGELYPEEMGEQSVYDDEIERKLAGTKRGTTSVDRKAAKVGTLANELADAISEERGKQRWVQPAGFPGQEGAPIGDTSKINVRTNKAREDLKGAQEDHATALQAAQEAVEHQQRTVALNAGPNASPEGAQGPSDGFGGMAADRLEKEMAGYNGASATRVRHLAKMQSLQTMAMHSIGKEGEYRTRARIMDLQEAYDEAIVDLGSLRVDPKRWEEDTPAVAQVLMALASSAFAFFSGGQGPNPIVQLIDKAIDRDVKAQMQGIQLKMKQTGLGLEQQDALAKMEAGLTSSMYQRVMNVTESMMKESQLLGSSEDMVNAHTAIMQRGLEVEMKRLAMYAKARERSAKYSSQKWDDPILSRAVVESRTSADDIGMLYEKWKGARDMTWGISGSAVGKWKGAMGAVGEFAGLGSTEMNEYNALKTAKILSIAAVMNKGRPTDKDFDAVAKLLPTSGLGAEAGAMRGAQMLDMYWRQTENTFGVLTPRDQQQARPSVAETLQGIAEVVRRNPELEPHISKDLRSAIGRINGSTERE